MSGAGGSVRLARARPLRRLRAMPRWLRRALAAAAVLVLVLAGAWLIVRETSVVAVEHVKVTGLEGRDGRAAATAMRNAALAQKTLGFDAGRVRSVGARFPIVQSVSVSTDLPHSVTLEVVAREPIATAVIGGRSVPVAADGTLLPGAHSKARLVRVHVRGGSRGGRLGSATALSQVAMLAAAPAALRAHVAAVGRSAGNGVTASLRGGPLVYFGAAGRWVAKWTALAAVLAEPGAAAAAYIDVSVPKRPALGSSLAAAATPSGAAASDGSAAAAAGTSSSSADATSSGTAAGTPPAAASAAGAAPDAAAGAASGAVSAAPAGG